MHLGERPPPPQHMQISFRYLKNRKRERRAGNGTSKLCEVCKCKKVLVLAKDDSQGTTKKN